MASTQVGLVAGRDQDKEIPVKRIMLLVVTILLLFSTTVFATCLKEIQAKAINEHECDEEETHFVINQVNEEGNAPASILVTWTGGVSAVIPLDKFTGGVAHYTTPLHLDLEVVSATAMIYDGWAGEFNLSHGPCGTGPTPTPENPTPTPTPTSTPVGPTPTPPGPTPTPKYCDDGRTDFAAFFANGDPGTVHLEVGGTDRPPVQTAVDAYGRLAAHDTLWPDVDGWRVRWDVPAEYRLVRVMKDGNNVPFASDGSFTIQRCSEYLAFFEATPRPTGTPENGVPHGGSGSGFNGGGIALLATLIIAALTWPVRKLMFLMRRAR